MLLPALEGGGQLNAGGASQHSLRRFERFCQTFRKARRWEHRPGDAVVWPVAGCIPTNHQMIREAESLRKRGLCVLDATSLIKCTNRYDGQHMENMHLKLGL